MRGLRHLLYEEENERRDLALFRWASMLPMYFLFFVLACVQCWDSPLWWYIEEHEFSVPIRGDVADWRIPSLPSVAISNYYVVAFEERDWPKEDHHLASLVEQLQKIAPRTRPFAPLLIRPEPDVRHERIVEVISAVRRAGIRDYRLW